MEIPVKSLGRWTLRKLGLYGLYSLKVKGPLLEDGWFASFDQRRSIDRNGGPIPYITYPALEFLKRRVRPEMSVFEYGCGASTLWWATRVAEVVACEHDAEWYQRIAAQVPANVALTYSALDNGDAYSQTILRYSDRFHIVVIDGRDRVRCATNSLRALKPDGVILWDNSDREEYQEGYQFLHENGFRRLEFVGLAPIDNQKSETSFFYRRDNCLGI
jgi:hypothetical protein